MEEIKDRSAKAFYEAIDEADQDKTALLITVIDGEYAGEKALFSGSELMWASDTGGFVRFMESHKGKLLSISESGLIEIDGHMVYAENLGSDTKLVICGAGHVSMAVIAIGKLLGMHVTVIDDRQELVQNAIAKGADEAVCKGFEEALREIRGDNDTYYVIVTRGHRYDMDCLRILARKRYAYIGMIGSRKKVRLVMETLAEEGVAKEFLDSVYAPIGLRIGAETPEEIAVAVMAQIIEVKNRVKRTLGFPGDIMKALQAEGRDRLVMATIIARQGSSPRGVGSKMLIAKDGSITGTIGGGLVEGSAIARGKQMLQDEERGAVAMERGAMTMECGPAVMEHEPAVMEHGPVIMYVDMSAGTAEEDGMVCGGRVQVLLEIV